MTARDHWEAVYARKAPEQLSWYRPHLERSLAFIESAAPALDSAIIDVGGGASTLVDDLLVRGYTNLTVLDASAEAIAAAKARLGARSTSIHWLVADVTDATLDAHSYDFWHDRAVFHFLRDESERRRYVGAVTRAVKPGGDVLVATFGPEGPAKCSELEVVRYDADQLHAEFGPAFRRLHSATEIHRTPWGTDQQFIYCHCRVEAG